MQQEPCSQTRATDPLFSSSVGCATFPLSGGGSRCWRCCIASRVASCGLLRERCRPRLPLPPLSRRLRAHAAGRRLPGSTGARGLGEGRASPPPRTRPNVASANAAPRDALTASTRAWASDDSRWDEPHRASRRPSSGARRRRVVHRADEASADARANEAFARPARWDERHGDSWRTEGRGHRARQVQTSQRARHAPATREQAANPARQSAGATRSRTRPPHARDEPFFREDAWWYEENGGTRRTDARAMGKRAARRAAREAAEAAEAEEFKRRFEERAAFPGAPSLPRFTATIAEASASVMRDFTSTSTLHPRDRPSGANRLDGDGPR